VVGEVIDGILYTQARPRSRHANVIAGIEQCLRNPFQMGRDGPGGWWILPEPGVELPGAPEVAPDVAGWRRTRMPTLPEEAIDLAPDWVCEVLSPSTHLVDRRTKMRIYAEEAIPHLWLVDPLVRSLEVYVLDGASYRAHGTFGENERVRVAPFEALELELEALWPSTVTPLPGTE